MQSSSSLPTVNVIGMGAPFAWLAGAWRDFGKAPAACLIYGAIIALVSFAMFYALVTSNASFWALALSCGFVFVAPMLAMGMYEAGRRIETGDAPKLFDMLFVRSAIRQDVAYLGLALLLIYLLWGRVAQIVYGLSTYSLHLTVEDFVNFALHSSEGHTMLISGTIVGGVIAFATYALVVVSAPMLLDTNTNVFAATVTSVRAVARNFMPLMLWAALIVAFLLASAATWFLTLVFVFPWLGLASWRGYRALVSS